MFFNVNHCDRLLILQNQCEEKKAKDKKPENKKSEENDCSGQDVKRYPWCETR